MHIEKDTLKYWRLVVQKLSTQLLLRPENVVEWFGGVQAQDYRWAKWSIGLRTDGCTDEVVEQSVQDHQIVRTWMFRGTLHFVSADDLAWLTSLLAPGIIKSNARRYRQLELDDAAFVNSQKVIQQAIEAQGPLTRAEIKSYFELAGVPAEGQQVPYLLQRAALDGLICQGPISGSEPTYVLISDWIEAQQSLDKAKALEILAMRYFLSHGPATEQDFAWWAGLSAREVRQGVESASALASIDFEGVRYWINGNPPPIEGSDCAFLLPPFDNYLLGYKERSLVLDPSYKKRVNPGGGMPKPTVMVNGSILGTWKYRTKKGKLDITFQPFRGLNPHERKLIDNAANQFREFISISDDVQTTMDRAG